MAETKHWIVKARNLITGTTLKQQDLTGVQLGVRQRWIAEEKAEKFARDLERRLGDEWAPIVELHTASTRRNS